MIALQTMVKIEPPDFDLSHRDKILAMGSCFAQNMSIFLKEEKFRVEENPFGILYNPLSIAKSLSAILKKETYQEEDLFYHNERWNSFDHHSDFSNRSKAETLKSINQRIESAHHQLLDAKALIVTLGTAFVYVKKSDGQFVANCHKIPSKTFEKRLLLPTEIVNSLRPVIEAIQAKNKDIQVILTVSPVRHLRDGIVENQRSKAALLLAVSELLKLPKTYYFPAYELLLDELRDYRFYANDLTHPSNLALQYIWERFSTAFFTDETRRHCRQFRQLRKALQHRPFDEYSEQHQAFLKQQLEKTKALQKLFPYLNFEEELSYFGTK